MLLYQSVYLVSTLYKVCRDLSKALLFLADSFLIKLQYILTLKVNPHTTAGKRVITIDSKTLIGM